MLEMIKLRRKSSDATLYFVISVILIMTFTLVGISTFARAQAIEVIGAERYTKTEIIEVSEALYIANY